jgi:hypothetical protein
LVRPGHQRFQLDAALRAAYDEGLLSQSTFVERIGQVLTPGVLHPERLVGDLTLRQSDAPGRALRERLHRFVGALTKPHRRVAAPLLALDWAGAEQPITVGRDAECDICLPAVTISRHHARLIFRDGAWIVHDLGSTNGTLLNGKPIGRARLRPGDRVSFADHTMRID